VITKPNTIEVVPYNLHWPQMFEDEASRIKQAVGDNCLEIHHIGSTAVPGLDAKPIIDIIMVLKKPTDSIIPLESIGYSYKGEVNIPFRFYFSKKTPIQVHLHVYEVGNSETELNLLFRNFLRSNTQAGREYTKLKSTLVEEQKNHKDVRPMFSHYTLGKNAFIRTVLQQAGFDKLRLMHCTHYAEWEAAKTFRQKYFFDNVPIADPYTCTFDHGDHVHFVLYKGTEIIGYTHLQRWPDQRIAMRIIVIDEPLRGQKFGSQLLELCERWLKKQEIKSIHVQASPKAYKFYCQHGYSEMPFNDPGNHESAPQDIDMGKLL
jgi:GrpB-like predicted nucleotidyltransferase (UPF0157 family)/GNAT superfamily N-acetyltransferase